MTLDAVTLYQAGRFAESLRVLDSEKSRPSGDLTLLALKAELLRAVGRLRDAQTLATDLLARPRLGHAQRSSCEYVLAMLAREEANTDEAIAHLHRAISSAAEGTDLARLCRAQTTLAYLTADRSGPDAARVLVSEIRANAIRAGDPRIMAALHVFVGELDARRGLLRTAPRHAALALELLRSAPHLALEAAAENLFGSVALTRADYRAALPHELRALHLAEEAGDAVLRRATAGNLGYLFYYLGDFDRAVDFTERGFRALRTDGDKCNGLLDNLARVHLSQGHLEECATLLARIERSIRPADRTLYHHRHSALTHCALLFRQGRVDDALHRLDAVLQLADAVGDALLRQKTLLTKAECLETLGRSDDFRAALDDAVVELTGDSPELYAQYERVLGSPLSAPSDGIAGIAHYERALRLCHALQSVPAEMDLRIARERTAVRGCPAESTHEQHSVRRVPVRSLLHSVAAVFTNAERPEIVGRELVAVLRTCECVHSAVLVTRLPDGREEVLDAIEARDLAPQPDSFERTLTLGSARGGLLELTVRPMPDLDAVATVNAAALLVRSLQQLQTARAEFEERATIWPANDVPVSGDGRVIAGHMREMMTFAQRVANTNVTVLIVGESGTGKEILARAIHDCSSRAKKPFVPVNCASIPRELLESQLFGHRRGAFTGADRDQPGFIRAARDGTLFLDEIGELSWELQPKLLRFLESGEIAPLGEATPQSVNVRVVAATNTKLETLVCEGKFREDLFYRLNVVRLALGPLRERRDEIPGLVRHFVMRAAAEFEKGHLDVADETMERLLVYRWPGNVRQLQNEIRRMVALADPNTVLGPELISDDILGALPVLRPATGSDGEVIVSLDEKLPAALARVERALIANALRDHAGSVDSAAKALGISRKGLYLKRQRLGL